MNEQLLDGLVYYIVFVFSVTVHEAAHAWAAKRGGDPTAYLGGQVSLDPLPHMRREPFGMVILPILSVFLTGWPFGFASAPYDPQWAERYPRRAAWMAAAGPAANLLLIVAAAAVVWMGISAGWFAVPSSVFFGQITTATAPGFLSAAAKVVSVLFSMNLVLMLLNLIPVPPLDGSSVIQLAMPANVARAYQNFLRQPMLGWIGILIAWRVFDVIFGPLFLFAVNLLYPTAGFG